VNPKAAANCPRVESVAAYLDGEMDAPPAALFESHVKECQSCAGALREQRRLMCLLDNAFGARAGGARSVELPADFARVVTAHARTDMGGVRSRAERAFSVKLSLALAAVTALLLGASAGDAVLGPAAALARSAAGVAGMLGHALLDAVATAVVILRAVGGRLVAGPPPVAALYCLLFAGASLLLLRLIKGYHRAR
jgi:predicted anti-sigma-YlaC factor YlaD